MLYCFKKGVLNFFYFFFLFWKPKVWFKPYIIMLPGHVSLFLLPVRWATETSFKGFLYYFCRALKLHKEEQVTFWRYSRSACALVSFVLLFSLSFFLSFYLFFCFITVLMTKENYDKKYKAKQHTTNATAAASTKQDEQLPKKQLLDCRFYSFFYAFF